MAEIVLSGAPIDLNVSKDGDLIVLTDTKIYVISLSRSKGSSMLSNITLPVNDFYHDGESKMDLPFMIAKRIWWLPSTANFDSVVLLTSSLHWLIYRRIHGLLQWTKFGQFCPELDRYFKHVEELKCSKFVDMVLIGPTLSKVASAEVTELHRTSAAETSVLKEQFVIDDNSMPKKYFIGTLATKKRKMKKMKTKIKKEYIIPAQNITHNGSRQNQSEEVAKPVIKQLTKVSSTGEKRLVTYIMDGKQTEDQLEEDNGEEKVLCVCGANEENSSEDEEWVECELCHTWQHVDCVAYFPEVQDYFHCDNCLKAESKKRSQSKNNSNRKGKNKGRPPKEKTEKSNEKIGLPSVENGSQNKESSEPQSGKINQLKDSTKTTIVDKSLPNNKTKDSKGPSVVTSKQPEQKESSDSEGCTGKAYGSDSSYGIIHRGNHINCPCGASDSESGEEWVQCDECDKWQHQLCVNYADEDKTHYQCPSCKQILTFFANKEFAPITADSLAAKRAAPSMLKGKFRIPKLSKNKDDGFEVVGSSCCNPSSMVAQSQPVYIPKSLEEASVIITLKSALSHAGNAAPSSPTTAESSNSQSEASIENMPSPDSSTRDMINDTLTNGTKVATETNSDGPCQNGRQINSFAVVLCVDCLIVLRGSPESLYEISSQYALDGRELCMMSVFSNSENTEHQIAMVDNNSDDVLVWKLSYCNYSSNEFSDSVKSLPSLVLTEETVLSSGKNNYIDRLMWFNQSLLLVYSMQEISCYDVVSSQLCWATEVKLDFVIDWFLQTDKKLVVFDNVGSSVVIDANNGNILQQNKCDQKDDVVVNSRISPSNMMKFELRIPANLYLQYNVPCKLNVSFNVFYSSSNTQPGEILSREQNFLKMNVQSLQNSFEADCKITEELCCPICNCTDMTPSNSSFEVTCLNKHKLFLDPDSMAIIDPFHGKECPNCCVFNLETALKCGSCNQGFIC